MRWLLILSFIIFFAPFAGAQDDNSRGEVQSLSESSYATNSEGDHPAFNEASKQSRVNIVLEQLGMTDHKAPVKAATADSNSVH
jgi:hypothetical protein